MNDNDITDQDLRERFQSLREFEAATAPAYRHPGVDEKIARTRPAPVYRVPLAAAALVCLFALPVFFFRPSKSPSLSENLPVLLPAGSGEPSLFAGLDVPPHSHTYLSDELLPFRFNLNR